MSRSHRTKGGSISYNQGADSFSTPSLNQIHIDKRVLPLFNEDLTKNISISEKYYNNIPWASASGGLATFNSTVNFMADSVSDAYTSLSESYFVVSLEVTDNGTAPNNFSDHSVLPFASHLFVDNLTTKISGVDVSDNHPPGTYAVSALHKQFLLKEKEDITVSTTATKYNLNANGDGKFVIIPQISSNGISSDSTLESLGYASETVDFQHVTPGLGVANNAGDILKNHNAIYYKNLVQYPPDVNLVPATYNQAWDTKGTLEFIIKPTDGIWTMKNYLPSNVPMQIQMKIATLNKIIGLATGDTTKYPTVTIQNLSLMLCRVKPTQETALTVNKVLLERPFVYNILNSITESRTISAITAVPSTATFNSLLAGITPNVVVITFVSKGAFERLSPNANNHWLDTHPLSSGNLRKINGDYNSITGAPGTNAGIPQISSMVLYNGSTRIPKNQAYCNNNDDIESMVFVQQTYNAYVSQCMDSDKPFLSYSHWLNCYTPYVFNLTNSDQGLFTSTDETQTGTLNLQVTFKTTTIDQYMFVTGLYYSQVSMNSARAVTRIGF